MITKEQLLYIMPSCKKADEYLPYINKYMEGFGINTRLRKCHFLATVALESAELNAVVENMNYSVDGLLKVFPKYFTRANASAYARNPQKIGSRVYANRMGNGGESSGEGYKYRGRGVIQITGKSNYKAYNDYLVKGGMVVDLLKNPELLEQPLGAFKSGCWWWSANGLNAVADKDDALAVRKKVNGGTNGLSQFKIYLQRAKGTIK